MPTLVNNKSSARLLLVVVATTAIALLLASRSTSAASTHTQVFNDYSQASTAWIGGRRSLMQVGRIFPPGFGRTLGRGSARFAKSRVQSCLMCAQKCYQGGVEECVSAMGSFECTCKNRFG